MKKLFLAAALAAGVAGSAFAISPEQVGVYTGTLTATYYDYANAKPLDRQTVTISALVGPDGKFTLVTSSGNASGEISLGARRGGIFGFTTLEGDPISIQLAVKGTSLTGNLRYTIAADTSSGMEYVGVFKLKKSKQNL